MKLEGKHLLLESTVLDVDSKWEFKRDFVSENVSEKTIDGKTILAIVEGVFFSPDGMSRNKRFYSRKFWESTLVKSYVKEKLRNTMMYGTIGHENKVVDEEDLKSGAVSHIITDLWISEDGKGMGKALILGTPSGRNLYTYMKAGSKIKPSSRAAGDYKSEDYKGCKVVDEDNYYLETFDFVLNPGILETSISLTESNDTKDIVEANTINTNESIDTNTKKEIKNMEIHEKYIQEIENSKNQLNEKLIEERVKSELALKEASELKIKNESLNEELETLKAKLSEMSAQISPKVEEGKISVIKEEYDSLLESASLIRDMQEKLEGVKLIEEEYNQYKELGLPASEINEMFTEVDKLIEIHEAYREMGIENSEDLRQTLETVYETLTAISEFGTYAEIKEVFERSQVLINKIQNEELDSRALEISSQFKTPVENVRQMLESMGEDQTIATLKSLKVSKKVVSESKEKSPAAKTNERLPWVRTMFETSLHNYDGM